MNNWTNTRIEDMTIENAMDAHNDGVNFVCGDGKLKQISCNPRRSLLNIIARKEV